MTESTQLSGGSLRLASRQAPNLALWVAIGLPTVAVLAGITTVTIAVFHPEHELPAQYHWEGTQLDRDLARAARAAALGVRAELDASDVTGLCHLRLQIAGPAPPSLELRLVHATRPELDRQLQLHRTAVGADGSVGYLARCQPVPAAHWRVELVPNGGEWSARSQIRGALTGVTLAAAGAPGP